MRMPPSGPVPAGPIQSYELLGELGRGGMATVQLARQLDLDRLVALKRLDGLAGGDDVRVRRFLREARLAASLSHPAIVTIHDTFAHDGVPYIAMEYVPGGSLRELIAGLVLEQIAGVLDAVLDGLAHAERRQIVHRDLKPENLMVTAEGAVKIADFGIAKATSAARGEDAVPLTTAGVLIGTPTYMAPEQAMGRATTAQTDLYALGVVAFEMLAGRPPFGDGGSSVSVLLEHVNDPPPPIERLRPGVDPALAAWVARMLAKDPRDRPAGARAARLELEDVILPLRGPRWRREAALPYVAPKLPEPPADRALALRQSPGVTQPPRRAVAAAVADRDPVAARRSAYAGTARRTAPFLVALVASAAVIAGAIGLVGTATPAPERDPAASVRTSAMKVPTAQPTAATTGETSAQLPPVDAAATPGGAATPDAVDVARGADAERQAARFEEEAQDTEGDGDEALTQQLRDVQYAYRDAAAAGMRGDTAGFDAALERADALARAATARLEADD